MQHHCKKYHSLRVDNLSAPSIVSYWLVAMCACMFGADLWIHCSWAAIAYHPALLSITLEGPFNSFGRKWNTWMAVFQSAGAICSQGRDIPEHVFHIKRVSGSHRCMLTGRVWYVCARFHACIWENRRRASEWADKEREGKKVFWCLLRHYSYPWAVNRERLHSTTAASCLYWPVNA